MPHLNSRLIIAESPRIQFDARSWKQTAEAKAMAKIAASDLQCRYYAEKF